MSFKINHKGFGSCDFFLSRSSVRYCRPKILTNENLSAKKSIRCKFNVSQDMQSFVIEPVLETQYIRLVCLSAARKNSEAIGFWELDFC